MLTGLTIRNIALIEHQEVVFEPGFTVLTGETGSGKSILLDALDAVTGGGQPQRLLRDGCERGVIEVCFRWSEGLRSWCRAQELDADGDEELVLSRELRCQEGRYSSRSRLNGVVLNRSLMAELRPQLLDLTGQGQTHQLARAGQQRRWLDRFGGSSLLACLEPVRLAQQQWRRDAQALEQARLEQESLQQDWEAREQQLHALDAAALDDPQERQLLEQEQDRLCHGVRLQQGCQDLQWRLQEGAEGVPSVLDHLAACEQELAAMAALDPGLEPLQQSWMEAHGMLQGLARELDRYAAALEADPDHLAALQERIAQLKTLERRYGLDLAALLERRDALRLELQPGGADAALEALEQAEQASRERRDAACAALSRERQRAAKALEQELMQALRPMALPAVRFEVALQPCDPAEDGAEVVQFLFSANPGQPLAPLREVASGGEMSRFLLALKTCLAEAEPHSTLLFDEIDTGVSGRVSAAMAELLQRLARHRQVFCVTHQPVVAAAADQHLLVRKQVQQGQTVTEVLPLRTLKERERELAELAGGDSGEVREYVASLLQRKAA
ncbi:MAG: DNA repair protein RecN [Synechococcus sp.]|nr:DNA repair protein RecN [Synechococcus sp.]